MPISLVTVILFLQKITPLFKKNLKIKAPVIGRLLVALLLIVGLLRLPVTTSQAADLNEPGRVDPTFQSGRGPNQISTGTSSFTAPLRQIELQNDGKILIAGEFTNYTDKARNDLVRLNSDGSVDNSFDPGQGINDYSYIYAIARQNDGKILITGDFTSYNTIPTRRIARLNADGSLDTSFNSATGASSLVRVVKLQNDGKIIIGGDFTSYNGVARSGIARLNVDGSLDTSFDPGSGAINNNSTSTYPSIYSILQSNGKILISGLFTHYNGVAQSGIARLNSDGSLDTSFDPGSGPNFFIGTAALQNDGKILISGFLTAYNGVAVNHLARLNTDGSLDTSFKAGSEVSNLYYGIALQSNGEILVVGDFTSYNGIPRKNIARLNSDGSLDTSFDPGSGPNHPYVTEGLLALVAVQSDSKILVGGKFFSFNGVGVNQLVRLNPNGSVDTSFNSNSGADGDVYVMELQKDGKILIGGRFVSYDGASRKHIARLNPDGLLDTSFNPGTGFIDTAQPTGIQPARVKAIKQLKDGKILIGGDFNSYNGTAIQKYARLNSDGSLDTSFNLNPPSTIDIRSNAIEQQSSGKILIGQYSTSIPPDYTQLIRVNLDGSVDTTFNSSMYVSNMALQSDDKIIVAKGNQIVRLNPDGTLDASFSPSSAAGSTVSLVAKLQNDGKIIVAGEFTTFNGSPRKNIARLNPDGSLDSSFDPGSSTGGENGQNRINTVSVQSDGKIIIGGLFTSYNGSPRKNIARLNSDGSLDTSFNVGAGANQEVRTSITQSASKVIIGGTFSVVDTYTRDKIARLHTSACNSLVVTSVTDDGQATSCGTLSTALASAIGGDTINFALSGGNNVINFGGALMPLLKAGVNLDGGPNGIILDGNGVNGDGLRVSGSNKLTNLTIRGFGGRELVVIPDATNNQLYRVKIES